MSLDTNELYQKYKNMYTVFWGHLVVKKNLSNDDITIIENNYKDWERIKNYGHILSSKSV